MFATKNGLTDFSPIDTGITCEISNYYSKAYLRHLFIANEILALQLASLQNLSFYLWLVGEARKQILNNNFNTWKNEILPILKQRL
ncbi:MAG: tRNA-guanine transglycosylase [Chitinophagaceae bacterium]